MTLLDLSLRQRLVLAAIVPCVVMPLDYVLDPHLRPALFLVYGGLYGGLVMAPFITSRDILLLRFGAIVFSPVLVAYTITALPWVGKGITIVAIWLFSTLVLAYVLRVAAPLRVSGKYWIYIAISGLLSGALSLAWLECCFPDFGESYPWWHYLFGFLPFAVSPISFSAAVCFGRIDLRQNTDGD